ncbi:MAG: DUF5654 family protein [Patescibacteria group bacterium]
MSQETEEREANIKLQTLEKMLELMTAAFSLVAALAWNDAIQSLFKRIFGDASSIYAKFAYAVLITVIIVILSHRVAKVTRALKKKLDKCP